MRGVVRAGDVVARLGGDEFAILLRDISEASDAGMVAEKIIAALSETIRLSDECVQVGASVGVALCDDPLLSAELFTQFADRAMYHAKRLGKNRYRFASGTGSVDLAADSEMRADLRLAVHDDALDLHYQPQFNAVTGQVEGL